ncbi:Nickel and cobalt resistance protein CnrB [Planctomycetes bacterium Pan216]|uniref:Nickel and cobalt resistance protein CnrB n=1 Tax=Kolteria novifilia TaxID=2527975 RepID=A0A518AXP5_9BACT|nr:Nickel and cobalt resistance protein CnrB [Planctomycetes bacterium Pan216]
MTAPHRACLVLALIAGSAFFCVGLRAQEKNAPNKTTQPVQVVDKEEDAKPSAAAPVAPADQSTIWGEPLVLRECPIRPLDDVKVPVRVAGVLQDVYVKEGSVVMEGDVLAKVDDKLARIALEAAIAKERNVSQLRTAQARENEAQAQYDDTKKLWNKGVESDEELRVKQAQLEIAIHGVADAKAQMQLASIERQSAAAEVELHEVTSPINGVVIQQVRQRGEAVEALDPIFRVIRTDVVRVEASFHARELDRVRSGMSIEVYPNKVVGDELIFLGHTGDVNAVVVMPDGRHCVSGGSEGQIIVWDILRNRQARVLSEHAGAVNCLGQSDLAPTQIVSGGGDRVLRLWDIESGKLLKEIETGFGDILALAMDPADPSRCMVSHSDRRIRLWNLKDEKIEQTFTGHTNYVTSLALTPDAKLLFSAGDDQSARFWEVATGKQLEKFSGRSTDVKQLGLGPRGKSFLFNSYSLLQVRSAPNGIPEVNIENPRGPFSDIAVFAPKPLPPSQRLMLAGTSDYLLQLWQEGANGRYPRLVRRYEGHSDQVLSVDFAPDGKLFVSGSADRSVRVWRVPTEEEIEREHQRGRIEFVNNEVEAGSQTVSLFAEVENKNLSLVPGSFATIVVYPDQREMQAKK